MIEKQIVTIEEETPIKKIDINTISRENLVRLHELEKCKSTETLNPKNPILRIPELIEDDLERSKEEYKKAVSRYNNLKHLKNSADWYKEDAESAKRSLDKELRAYNANKKRIKRVKKFLIDKGFDYNHPNKVEEVISEFLVSLIKQFNEAFEQIARGELPSAINKLILMLRIIDLYEESTEIKNRDYLNFPIKDSIKKLQNIIDSYEKNNLEELNAKPPEYGSDFIHFMKIDNDSQPIDKLPDKTICLLDSGVLGFVRTNDFGKKAFRVILQSRYHSTGLGIGNPVLDIDNIDGEVFPIDIFDREEQINPRDKFEQIIDSFQKKKISIIETHAFDPVFLIKALKSGKWSLPSLEGFQVESRSLDSEHLFEFQYFNPEKPYFTFIFNGDILEKDYPSSVQKNVVSRFHFIPGGLDFSNPAFMHCIVTPNFKKQLIKWFEIIGESEKQKILGNKDPNEFFITDIEDR